MPDGRKRSDVKVGGHVRIVEKHNQDNGKLTEGVVRKILTAADEHPHGIKVELESGKVGRVKEIIGTGDNPSPPNLVPKMDASQLESIITKGEGQTIEFKSSFRFDIKRFEATGVKERNKEVEKAVSKTVASFLNADGGYTFIGITDEGKAIGIEADLDLMNKKNTDTFRLQLKNSLESYLLNKIIYEHIQIEFPVVQNKQVCVIHASRCSEPIFVHDAGKQECYVRVDNESKPYQYDEFLRYWQRRDSRQ